MTTRLLLALAALSTVPLAAQTPRPTLPPVRARGEIGSEGELYGITGRDPRRPAQSGNVFFRPSLAFGSLRLTGNFLLSTEGNSPIGLGGYPGRQQINQFGLTPQWRWGKAHLGSFADSYTPLTWSGVRVNGAGFDVSPGVLRLGAFAGSSRQAVFGGATTGSFARHMAGGRIGIGRRPDFGTGSTFLDVVFIRAWDDAGSLPPVPDSLAGGLLPDSLRTQPDTALLPTLPLNPFAVTPQDNAVISTAAGTSLFGGALGVKGELAGSIHSRDRRASGLSPDVLPGYPRLLRGLITPRVGTHADVAFNTEADLRIARLPGATTTSPRSLTARLVYRSIGAGYVSLGTPYTPNDLRGIDYRTSLRLRHWTLQIDGLSQHDNLLGQKLGTTHRSRVGALFVMQPARSWNTLVRVSTMGMTRDIPDSLGAIDYSAKLLGITQSWIPGHRVGLRSLTASYTRQWAGDANPLRSASTLDSHAGNVRLTLALTPDVSISPTVGVIQSLVGSAESTTRGSFGLAGNWRDPERRWTTSGSLSRSQVGRSNALNGRLSVRYQLTGDDTMTLTARLNSYRNPSDSKLNFVERILSLRWSRHL